MPENSPTGGAPDPPEPLRRSKKVECGYCDCVLDADGEIITMGKRAKEFRATRENEETRINRISVLEAEVADLKAKLAAASTPGTPAGDPPKRKTVLESVLGR